VKFRSRILDDNNSECILHGSACVRLSAQNIIARPQNHLKSAVTRLTTSYGVCFASESIVPRSQTSTNWKDSSTANGLLCVARSLNVLASGDSIYALAFVLEADIFSACCNKDDVMW